MSVFDFTSRRWFLVAIGIYSILLLASFVVLSCRAEKPVAADKKFVIVAAVAEDELLDDAPVRLAYKEYAPAKDTGTAPVILLHGSPGDSGALTDLAEELSATRRVIVPDLPGFGDSTEKLSDYSFRAHAFYVRQLADNLKIEKFHVLGFSMGGGVALNLEAIAPTRVLSIEMVSAIGVQEYELLGDYRLNHILHGAQLAAIWALQNLVPHFGLLDNSFFNHSYARNFYDSDQRPLRAILEKIEVPVLIVHGTKDPLVPVKAAREHYRLVPQSEYHELDDNHFMVFMRPEKIAPIVADFLRRADERTAETRTDADPDRIARAAEPFQKEMVMADGSTAIVFFLVLVIATFISEDLTCLTAGALAGQGQISLSLAITACAFGIFAGDLLLYFAGRFFGRRAVRRAPVKWFVSEKTLDRGAAWLGRNGMNAVFLSRLTPGLRLPVYFAAGMLKTRFLTFTAYFAIAALVWTPVLVGATAWASGGMMGMMGIPMFSRNFWFGLVLIVGAAFIVLNLILRLSTWRGRRMLAGTFLRWTRWEFWSLRTFYIPIVFYIGWLAIKYRSLTIFADANPAIEAGGFVGEPKQEIYEGLQKSVSAKNHLLRYTFIPGQIEKSKKIKIVENFLRENKLNFPIAFKPNAGERGTGVFIVKTKAELINRIEESRTDLILQEYAQGLEFGVFYYRYPNETSGKIFAITEKRFPAVTGDGLATLETLILRDRRAVALAGAYFERNAERLNDVPKNGEIVPIIDIGTHSKGAIFLDGGWAKTEKLEIEIDAVCRGYEGFYFGRFDLRSASAEEFKQGKFKIIELNGVTSEATSIYDPKNSLFAAYRVLFQQWRIAFEIGAQNRALGANPTSAFHLARLIYQTKFGTVPIKSKTENSQPEIEDVPDTFRV